MDINIYFDQLIICLANLQMIIETIVFQWLQIDDTLSTLKY